VWGRFDFLFREYVEELRIGFLGLEPAKRGRGMLVGVFNLEIRRPSKLIYYHLAKQNNYSDGVILQYIYKSICLNILRLCR
jgi:hypothetical protein